MLPAQGMKVIILDGFTYNGIHSETLGVYYAPGASDCWEPEADFETVSTEVQGRHGGYFYGTRVKSRTITLSCYYEDIDIEKREEIKRWLGRNTSGILEFDHRPYEYYKVFPSKVVTGNSYNHRSFDGTANLYSATFTVTFTAYEPFGFLKGKDLWDPGMEDAFPHCGALDRTLMPPTPTVSDRQILLYNCGTEVADTVITLAGSAPNGLTITNRTNGDRCA